MSEYTANDDALGLPDVWCIVSRLEDELAERTRERDEARQKIQDVYFALVDERFDEEHLVDLGLWARERRIINGDEAVEAYETQLAGALERVKELEVLR